MRSCKPYALLIGAGLIAAVQAASASGILHRPPIAGYAAALRHAHPASIDRLAADFPKLKIVMAHPGWPWVEETTAVALHKGNVYWEMSGWAPKYFPGNLKVDMRGRLQDKIMFGSDYPSMPYERILKEWKELGYSDAVMEKIFHQNAERILGL